MLIYFTTCSKQRHYHAITDHNWLFNCRCDGELALPWLRPFASGGKLLSLCKLCALIVMIIINNVIEKLLYHLVAWCYFEHLKR